MKEKSPYHAVGLWRVWERGAPTQDPYTSAPTALVESLVGTYGAAPSDEILRTAQSAAEEQFRKRHDFEHLELVKWVVVGSLGWEAMRSRSDWRDDQCLHTTASDSLIALHIYGLRPQSLTAGGSVWEPARRDPRSLDAVTARARAAADVSSVPEYETYGDDVPFFIRPWDDRAPARTPYKTRERRGDRGMG